MMRLEMSVSLRDCGRAYDAINDCHMLSAQLSQVSSDVWESEEMEDDEYDQLECDLEDQMSRFGVEEYEIMAKRCDDIDPGFSGWDDYNRYKYGC